MSVDFAGDVLIFVIDDIGEFLLGLFAVELVAGYSVTVDVKNGLLVTWVIENVLRMVI